MTAFTPSMADTAARSGPPWRLLGGCVLVVLDLGALAVATATNSLPGCVSSGSGLSRLAGCFAFVLAESAVRMPLIYLALAALVACVVGVLAGIASQRASGTTPPGGGVLGGAIALVSLALELVLLGGAIAVAILATPPFPAAPGASCGRACGPIPLPSGLVELLLILAVTVAALTALARMLVGLAFGALGAWLGRTLLRDRTGTRSASGAQT